MGELFVIAGSSAAALTGLMFVVITLVSGVERVRHSSDGISTYSTPTVMHFCVALFVSATLCAPWRSFVYPSVLLGLGSLYESVYIVRVIVRTRALEGYTPDAEDWVWYCVLPLLAYGVVLAGSAALAFVPGHALFALATGEVALIFIGIRNAWDVVTYLAVRSDDP